jgi:hypothetical chaperone protein
MIVGMDFGTTNSGMAVFDGEKLQMIPLDPSSSNPAVTPTALYITNDREVFIGRSAIDMYYEHNLNRPSRMERVKVGEIEQTFAELPSFFRDVYVEKDVFSPGRLFVSFKMGLSNTDFTGTIVGNYYYYLEDIIAIYLYATKKRAETYLNTQLDTIVLGRPVRYSDDASANEYARERMIQAAFRAGYKRVYLQYEPVAAAHFYETRLNQPQNVLIFDFGGGTLDISILRLGDAQRQVMATGGIPIAGNVFDERIVRAKMPAHFGEGDSYRAADRWLPVPNSYYEAFANWQELLLLQLPDRLESIRKIERTARHPGRIRALLSLITGQYGLKMFDIAESVKRLLSSRDKTDLIFAGRGFSVIDSITRAEFERIIRHDIQAIAERLDGVVAASGLDYGDIDSVIRTGGSSQIPAFIEMLETRFGSEKVRALDIFSSVTAGLGVLAHQIARDEIEAPVYRAEDGDKRMQQRRTGDGVPHVDLDLMKRLLDVKESHQGEQSHPVLVVRNEAQKVSARDYDDIPAKGIALNGLNPNGLAEILPADEALLMMTNEYRLFARTAQQLVDLYTIGTSLETVEDFTKTAFSAEMVCAVARWQALQGAEMLAFVSTLGYARLIDGEKFLSRLRQPIAHPVPKMRGYPAALVNVHSGGDIVAFTHSGRAVRLPVALLAGSESRLVNVPLKGRVISVQGVNAPCEFIIITAGGYAMRLHSDAIPQALELNTTGAKVIAKTDPVGAVKFLADKSPVAITTQRVLPVDVSELTSDPQKLLRLKTGETLIHLTYL